MLLKGLNSFFPLLLFFALFIAYGKLDRAFLVDLFGYGCYPKGKISVIPLMPMTLQNLLRRLALQSS